MLKEFKELFSKLTTGVITIELDERYDDKTDLTNAVALYLTEEGSQCEVIDKDTIVVDGFHYTVNEKIIYSRIPFQQVVLRKIKE
ncbi:MAG: hypothetical protein CVV02_16560 [Firmicutes bacterium HGW-Firmicutes-7]|nr:MAG: hypothetical protein CVV02_16560 [Firmicutes bacterium HGW-Firmicutes-7]